jgi:DNA end-binding protein Ku
MPRAIWSGAISFGLVNVPVRMYSAVSEHSLRFNYIHVKDGSRIGYEKFCKAEGKPVPDDEIAKAFDWEGEEYVVMADEDFDAAAANEQGRTIDIKDFVDYDDIDPIYFERTYTLGPAEGFERVYALLVRAMEESGLAAIAKYVMRDKQSLGCLRVREGVITLEKMYFADEIRPLEPIHADLPAVEQRELDMAEELIARLHTDFAPERYSDTYRDTLCEIIKRKREGETITAPEHERSTSAPDLIAALQASLDRSKSSNGKPETSSLEGLSKDELYKRAQEHDIPGRADMTKGELVEALTAA